MRLLNNDPDARLWSVITDTITNIKQPATSRVVSAIVKGSRQNLRYLQRHSTVESHNSYKSELKQFGGRRYISISPYDYFKHVATA